MATLRNAGTMHRVQTDGAQEGVFLIQRDHDAFDHFPGENTIWIIQGGF